MEYKRQTTGCTTRLRHLWSRAPSPTGSQPAAASLRDQHCSQYHAVTLVKTTELLSTRKGRAAVQRDLDRLQKRTGKNLMKFSKGKRKALHLKWDNPIHQYRPTGQKIAVQKRLCLFFASTKLNDCKWLYYRCLEVKDSSWSMQQRKGLLAWRYNPSSPKLCHLREKPPVSPYIVRRKGVRRTDVYLRVMLRLFSLFCFAPSIDFKYTLLGANIVTRNDSLPREKLWLIHQFKTTWTVTTGHKSCRKKAAWLSNEKLRTDFSPEGKASGLRKKMGGLYERLQKSWDTMLSKRQAKTQAVLKNYTLSKNVKRIIMLGTKTTYPDFKVMMM